MADAETIAALCRSWRSAAIQADGSLVLGGDDEKFRLRANDIIFHGLDHDALRAACVGLSSVLLLPGRNTVIDHDHFLLWSWCGEVLCGSSSSYWAREGGSTALRELMGLSFRASLVGAYDPSEEGWRRSRDLAATFDVHTLSWTQGSHTALAYLAFPLLEGIIKLQCSAYVSTEGTVSLPWSCSPPGGKKRSYAPGQRCSSLRDLLSLLREYVAGEELSHDLTIIEQHLSDFSNDGSSGFEVLYDWRNGSLHGASLNSTVGGTVMNIAVLIALSAVRDGYEDLRLRTVEQVKNDLAPPGSWRSPQSYYPPWV